MEVFVNIYTSLSSFFMWSLLSIFFLTSVFPVYSKIPGFKMCPQPCTVHSPIACGEGQGGLASRSLSEQSQQVWFLVSSSWRLAVPN